MTGDRAVSRPDQPLPGLNRPSGSRAPRTASCMASAPGSRSVSRMSSARSSIPFRPIAGELIVGGNVVRLGVGLGPFYASTRVGGGRRGNGGCLTGLLIVCFLPFYLIWKLYEFAWNKPQTRRGKILSVSAASIGLLILVIIGSVAGGGSSSPTLNPPSPVASFAPVAADVSITPSPTHKAAASNSTAPVTASAAASSSSPAPVRTQAPATTAPPSTAPTTAPAAPPTTAPAAPPTTAPAAPACSPLTSGGNCYEPGEFCPAKDHGMSGIAGDGKAITCSYYSSSGTWHWKD
jgi:hypothetical protein